MPLLSKTKRGGGGGRVTLRGYRLYFFDLLRGLSRLSNCRLFYAKPLFKNYYHLDKYCSNTSTTITAAATTTTNKTNKTQRPIVLQLTIRS